MNNQVATWYEEGIHKLMPRYDKCPNVNGDYVEKLTKVCAKICIFSFCIVIKEYGETFFTLWTVFVTLARKSFPDPVN